MDAHAKAALDATKALWKRLGKTGLSVDERSELKALAAKANKAVQAMQRLAGDQVVRADVRESILREALRDELIDREANAARVLDRQRLLSEGRQDAGAVFERALLTAQQIESNIGALCPHQAPCASGVAVLASAW